ncbi:GspE/PulE family protein [Zavarzinia sp.]|uniref:GspE/PulE family protein n=1 Tax=Zavarzinia sp. TaxID=2027920 RepID=UPI0035622225
MAGVDGAGEQAADLAGLLLARGVLPAETLARARTVEAETRESLGLVLTRLGLLSEESLAATLAEALGLPLAEPSHFPAAPVLAERLGARFLRRVGAVPLAEAGDTLDVAFADPLDAFARTAIAFAAERVLRPHVARAGDVEAALDRLYGAAEGDGAAGSEGADDADLERLRDLASDAPVVRLVNGLIARAVEAGASDIHLEPAEDGLKQRLRIDGVLIERETLPAGLRASVVSRIKVMAGLDIAERRLPQDGRLRLAVRGHDVDFRVATAPVIHGESVVLRILDQSRLALDFATLGFAPGLEAAWRHQLARPHGIVLVTGPTGSGKTTTLYASLAALNGEERKILTIEDPIEYRLAGISQTQVKPKIGLDFAAALRAFLRHDPNVMMVGEIRDLETLQVAIQAALTGHTILSTLHTNDAPSAVTRMLDMGAEPYLIASTVNAVMAQRLVRRLCPACRAPDPAGAAAFAVMRPEGPPPSRPHRPVGCHACNGSGFKGRIAIAELLPVSEAIGHAVLARAEAGEIRRLALAEGMRAMLDDGLDKAAAGETTVDEVLSVTREG